MSSTLYYEKATAAALHDNINNPPTHTVTREVHYNVAPGAAPTFVPFAGRISRLAVQFNNGGVGISTIPYKVTIPYRRIGNPAANIKVGIRKASDDSFQLISEWPTNGFIKSAPIITINVEGSTGEYQMLANDKISIEHSPTHMLWQFHQH